MGAGGFECAPNFCSDELLQREKILKTETRQLDRFSEAKPKSKVRLL